MGREEAGRWRTYLPHVSSHQAQAPRREHAQDSSRARGNGASARGKCPGWGFTSCSSRRLCLVSAHNRRPSLRGCNVSQLTVCPRSSAGQPRPGRAVKLLSWSPAVSWKATAFVAEIVDNITRSEKLLLLCLSNAFNDHEGCAWVSLSKLARESLMGERTAQRAIDGLVAKGFIEVGERPGQSSIYIIIGLDDGGPTPAKKGPTPVKMAGVSNWRTSDSPDSIAAGVNNYKGAEMTPHPRQNEHRNDTPPPSKELITSDTLDSIGADEQRTVNEPSIEPSTTAVAGAPAPREPDVGGPSLFAFRQALDSTVLGVTVRKLTTVPPVADEDIVVLSIRDTQLGRQLQPGNIDGEGLRKAIAAATTAAGFKGYRVA